MGRFPVVPLVVVSQSTDAVLRSIADKYEVVRKLGEGGMGAVYQVRHRLLDQLRVVKVMRPQLGRDESFEVRFKREAKVAAELRHPHIATLHDFDVTPEGTAYIVMEFVEGVTFEHLLDEEPPPLDLTLRLAHQTLEALGYLHGKGFVHRDISPDNLMYHRDPMRGAQVVLIDLGIAKRLGGEVDQNVTEAGAFLGKVRYGSPEQFGSQNQPSAASDIYSFGLVLYELLTGRHPIEGTTTASVIAAHVFRPPLSFEETDPAGAVPGPVRKIVLKALAKNPGDRFSDAAEMVAALDEAIVERAPTARTALEPERSVDVPDAPAGAVATGSSPPSETGETRALRPGEVLEAPAVTVPAEGPERPRVLRILLPLLLFLALAAGLATWWSVDRDAGLELPPEFELGPRYALVVGNNDYESQGRGLTSLISAVPDARAVSETLEKRYGYTVERLENATREQMANAVYGLENEVGPDHNLIIYYAGHGEIDPRGNGYWLPVDAEPESTALWFSNKELDDVLADIEAKRILVIADSCFSGTLLAAQEPDSPEEPDETLYREPARWVLTSGGTEPILDTGRSGHSLFTGALLEELREERDEVLTSARLYRKIDRALSRVQAPRRAPLPGHGGGEFLLVPLSEGGTSS